MSVIDEETAEQMARALDDIKEWFEDQGAGTIIENLSPGASLEHIIQVTGTRGLVVHPELQWLYMQHDGQPQVERFPLFEWCTFFDVQKSCAHNHESMMMRYFGAKSVHDAVDRDYIATAVFNEPLEPGELDTQWFPFANRDGDFYAVHARTGRVARFLKGDSPPGVIVAPSLCDFLCDYADALWRDMYVISGDTTLEYVVEEGHVFLGAHAQLCAPR